MALERLRFAAAATNIGFCATTVWLRLPLAALTTMVGDKLIKGELCSALQPARAALLQHPSNQY